MRTYIVVYDYQLQNKVGRKGTLSVRARSVEEAKKTAREIFPEITTILSVNEVWEAQ